MARNFVQASDQRIDVAGLPDFTSKVSVGAWVRTARSVGADEFFTVFAKIKDGNDRNIGFDHRIREGVKIVQLYWTQPVSTFIEYWFEATLTAGTWFHLLWTVDWTTNPDQVAGYLNGVSQSLISVGSNNATPTTGTPQVAAIGRLNFIANAWDGDIAELAIWTDVLSAGEARALAKGYSPMVVRPSGLALYAPLVRELFDYTGKTTLTNQGSTAANLHPPVNYGG